MGGDCTEEIGNYGLELGSLRVCVCCTDPCVKGRRKDLTGSTCTVHVFTFQNCLLEVIFLCSGGVRSEVSRRPYTIFELMWAGMTRG